MLVTLRKQDLLLHCFDNDVEKYMAARERRHYKQKYYLPGIRKTIFASFEVIFGVSESQLLNEFTLKGEKVDKRFLQRQVTNAVNAFFLYKTEPEEFLLGDFQRLQDESNIEGQC